MRERHEGAGAVGEDRGPQQVPEGIRMVDGLHELREGIIHLRARIEGVAARLVGAEPTTPNGANAKPLAEKDPPLLVEARRVTMDCHEELQEAHRALSRIANAIGV